MSEADRIDRVKTEYCDLPGLQLTVAQACRLWHVDPTTCEAVLHAVVVQEFLERRGIEHGVGFAQPGGVSAPRRTGPNRLAE